MFVAPGTLVTLTEQKENTDISDTLLGPLDKGKDYSKGSRCQCEPVCFSSLFKLRSSACLV